MKHDSASCAGKKVEPAEQCRKYRCATVEASTKKDSGIEIQEAPTTSSSEKNPGTPELAIEDGSIEDAHDAFATANESGPDETSAEDQSSEQAHGISESADENDRDEAEELRARTRPSSTPRTARPTRQP